jgi:signal transduction histidine kinase
VILLLAALQAVLAVGLWWLGEDWRAPKTSAPESPAPLAGVERLADLYAAAAARFVITSDPASLAHLVRRAATWPEIVYVGVEDAQGKVLAHTDPARVGKIWSEAISTKIRATAGAAHREVTVPMVDPGPKEAPPLGRVRIGYIAIDDATTSAASPSGRPSLVPLVVIAVVAAIPLGALVAILVTPSRRPGDGAWQSLEHLAQVASPERERLAAEVRRLRTTLGERDRDLVRLKKELELAARPLDPSHQQAIISIAQAVRTSLTNILGFSKLLLRELEGPLTESQTADVLNIQLAGTELLRFVTALSELTRAEAGQVQPQPELVDIPGLLHELAEEYGSAHSLDMKVECPPELPPVRTDRAHLMQIVHPLIMQATVLSGHGEVVLRPRSTGTTIDIAVAHPGRVIPDEELATIFDPFNAKETSAARVALALARCLASLNGGGISVESRVGHGVVFTLTVPLEAADPGPADRR